MTRPTPTTDPGKQPDLAVVVPAWNERENIELLLPALKEMIADLGLTAEIIIADGGSRDGTAEAAQRRGGPGVVEKEPGDGVGRAHRRTPDPNFYRMPASALTKKKQIRTIAGDVS